ncbi:MAG: hypothetical protein ACR2JB_21735 [Bryobacteraceae bacterium]
MTARGSLSVKILSLAFLNVLLLGLVFLIFARVQFRFGLGSFLLAPARDRMLSDLIQTIRRDPFAIAAYLLRLKQSAGNSASFRRSSSLSIAPILPASARQAVADSVWQLSRPA